MYEVFLDKWLAHFPASQLLLVSSRDLLANTAQALERIFGFLDLPSAESLLSGKEGFSHILDSRKRANVNPRAHRTSMLPSTRALLEDFYRPYDCSLKRAIERFNLFDVVDWF